ncbi:MAG: hypothetical protein DRH20_10340, partial [Deltaproteobacteria bacterium]
NAYKFAGTLKREFSSMEEAQGIARLMSEKYPDMVFQPHIELTDSSVIDLTDMEEDDTEELVWDELEKTVADLKDLDQT